MDVSSKLSVIIDLIRGDISSEQAGKELIELIPPFELRVMIVLGLAAFILIINGIALIRRKKKSGTQGSVDTDKSAKDIADEELDKDRENRNQFASNFNFIPWKLELIKNDKSDDEAKENIFKRLIGFIKSLKLRRRKPKKKKSPGKFGRFMRKRGLLILNIFLGLIIIVSIGLTLFVRPILLSTHPVAETRMAEGDEKITVEFDLPVDQNSIEFNVSPEIEGEWKFEKIVDWLPYSRKASFHPKQSFFPDNEVIIYIVGLRSPWIGGKKHEQAIEFRSPKIPEVKTLLPEDGSENIPVDTHINAEYDAPVGDFIDIQYKIDPPVEFSVTNGDNIQDLEFEQELAQDQQYKVEVYRTPRSYDVKTREDIERGETEKISEFSFNTVTTPLVESYKPKGKGVLADSSIEIVFDQPMDAGSVEENMTIEPQIKGDIVWKDEKTLTIDPTEELKKETEYRFFIKKGVLSKYQGKTEEDIEIKFTTIGKVKVAATSPVAGASGLDPTKTNVVVEFNQKVDHASAQSKFSISPAVSGSFGWEGNKLIFYTAGKLSYSTSYRVTVASGVKSVNGLDSVEAYSFVFTTKPNLVVLNIPWYKQQESFTCNLAATRMALAYRGVYVSENQIRSAIGIGGDPNVNWVSGYGVHWGPIANYIGQYRGVAVKTGWNTAALAKEVEKGNPVIVWWYNRYSQPPGAFTLDSGATGYMGMHSEVVRGFVGSSDNPTSLLTNDPWRGRLTYSRAGFDSTWAYMGYIAVVVY